MICYITWIPSKTLETFLFVVFIGLGLYSIYLLSSVIKESYKILNQKYSTNKAKILNIILSLTLVGLFTFVNLINFLIISFSGTYVKEYVFDDKKFYLYDTSFRDRMTQISIKMDYLPIRKEIVEVQKVSKDVILYRDKNMIYFLWEGKRQNLYDLKRTTVVITWC